MATPDRELRAAVARVRRYMDDDTDHPAFCVVPNGAVLRLLAAVEKLGVLSEREGEQ